MTDQRDPAPARAKTIAEALWDKFKKYPLRRCQSMHECAACEGTIHYGEQYLDGGHGRRAHYECVRLPTGDRAMTPAPARAALCWLCFVDRIDTRLNRESRCPVHGLVKDRVLGFVQVDTRLLEKADG